MLRKIFCSRFGRFGRAKAQSNLTAGRFGRAMAVGLESDITQSQAIGAMGGECGLVPAGSEITGGKHFRRAIAERRGELRAVSDWLRGWSLKAGSVFFRTTGSGSHLK